MNKVHVAIEGKSLALSNLGKPLYPHFTKGEVIDYYTRISPVLLPHLRDRVATRVRFPEGVDGLRFFEKNAPRGTPEWVRTETVATPGGRSGSVEFVVIDDLPTLVWCANLAALELHVPQWRVGRPPDLMVFDLDPGAPAAFSASCEVGLLLRDLLAEDGLEAYPKSSGKKGLHLYVPIKDGQVDDTSAYAKRSAERLAKEQPGLVVSKMDKSLRGGKVLVDWSQNNPSKTTVAPYSLRAADEPRVSTPLTWEEVEKGEPVPCTAEDVLVRVAEKGDLLAPLIGG
ncbi:bifunctional non-homologous end joining protein LigD [Actinocorallia herbida]|uniref:Bifunctional non-homologous end joining protein LigD n=1 Tax=Actinocorallia herbida TaxID=58109 RepID=A0A3N1CP59_9ACTN|nr:non-homologous end-joining DNA ligase [Actinocorallia herbida]ROO83109.1 bifunctional non-homologous end joining protein LigD [Actinocorallia herbida]